MDADYSVELGSAAPALEIPWQDPEGQLHYIDLRAKPIGIEDNIEPNFERSVQRGVKANIARQLDRIPEAQQFPALRRFLIDLNSPPCAWQTAKCDVWRGEAEAAENLYGAGYCQGCYVDIVLAEQAAAIRGSLEVHRRWAKEIAQRLEANEVLQATAEIVVRRCYFHHRINGIAEQESEAGYCLTLFLTGYGASAEEAAQCWGGAMEFAAGCWLMLQPEETSPVPQAKDRELS